MTPNRRSCHPTRRVRDFPRVEASLTITVDAAGDPGEIVFLVPRNDDILFVGGLMQPHEADLDLELSSAAVVNMRRRCEAFLPSLRNARVDPEYPVAQGLRPFRARNVRVERELRPVPCDGNDGGMAPLQGRYSRIVHSYGQGGSGRTLSFGCAADVANLVEEALRDVAPTPMDLDHSFFGVEKSGSTFSSSSSVTELD